MYIDNTALRALVIFVIILSAFFIYFIISEGIDNDKSAIDRAQAKSDRDDANIRGNITDAKLNRTIASLDSFVKAWYKKQILDNIRFNTTLIKLNNQQAEDDARFNQTIDTLNKTYDLIVANQKLIINLTHLQIDLTNLQNNNTAQNLNLTKFNKAATDKY